MKLACNIRWRLRLELQQLHEPRKQMSNWMSEYCLASEGAEITWGWGVRVGEKRQQDPGQLLCVSQNACQWRIFLAWDMQTWTKNEFTIQKAENRRSGYFQILWAAASFFIWICWVGSRCAFSYFYAFVMTSAGFQLCTKNNSICLQTLQTGDGKVAGIFKWKSEWQSSLSLT